VLREPAGHSGDLVPISVDPALERRDELADRPEDVPEQGRLQIPQATLGILGRVVVSHLLTVAPAPVRGERCRLAGDSDAQRPGGLPSSTLSIASRAFLSDQTVIWKTPPIELSGQPGG
jgi:hypothetical protein